MFKTRITLLASMAIFGGCALDSGAPRVRVVMPSQGPQQISLGMGGSLLSFLGPAAPASYSNFHCFGLNVTGTGVGKSPICANEPTAGKVGGFAPFSGGSVDVRVPAGPARTIELLGIMTSDGTCPLANSMSSNNNGLEIAAYHLGETTVDLFEDKRVSIQAQYVDASTAVGRLQNCGDTIGDGTIANAGELGPAQWMDVGWSAGPTQQNWADLASNVAGTWNARIGGVATGQDRIYHQASVINGRPGLEFNTAIGHSVTAMASLDSPTAVTQVVVASRTAGGVLQVLLSSRYTTSVTSLNLGIDGAGVIRFAVDATGSFGPTVTNGTPYIIVGVWDGVASTQALYVNGVEYDAKAAPAFLGTLHDSLTIGGNGSGDPLNGIISETALYDRALSVWEREALECHLGQKYNIPISGHSQVLCP